MLPIKKIYVDSRYKSSDSASHADFSIDLPQTFLMPQDTGFYIDDVCIPHSWYTIETGVNNFIVVKWAAQQIAVELEQGLYTGLDLNGHIVAKMNANSTFSNKFTSDWSAKESTIGITVVSGSTFGIPSNSEITDAKYKTNNVNKILKNDTRANTERSKSL